MSLLFSLLSARKGLVTDLSTVGVRADTTSHAATPDDHGHANYDVIIIGGGTAGCCLASRLSENSSVRVLLLESGGSGKGHIYTRIPAAFPLIFRNPKWVYQLYTEPQPFAGGKVKFWPRGKMLGGCSAINAEMAQYGAPGDFDQWAKICGDESWAWKNFKTYFTKFESYGLNEKNPNVDLDQRGTKGPVRVGYFGGVHDTSLAFVKTCEAIGIPSSPDFNVVEGQKGVNRVLTYIDDNRQRVTSQTAYLTPEVLARPNLKVAIHASVTRILFQDLAGGGKRAIGVEFANGPKAVVHQAFAKREVILSGGAIHSPQILMLSGIGPAEDLQALDIPLVKNLPAVGSNLYDHPVVDLTFKDKTKNAPIFLKPDFNISEILAYFKAAVQYFVMGTGPMATNLTEAAAFIRSDNADLFEGEGAKADTDDIGYPDLESPDLELFTSAIGYHSHGQPLKPHSFGLHAVLLHPLSVGRISLKTSNPWDDPKMDPRYFENEADVKKLSRGVRLCLKLAQTEPLTAFVDTNTTDPRFDHTLHKKNDEEIEALVRDRVETLYHPTSTCRMAHLEDGGVVDSKLRVYGIEGLRVCDASIFPSIISGHTAGAVYAVAEKLSDILRDEFVVRSIVQ